MASAARRIAGGGRHPREVVPRYDMSSAGRDPTDLLIYLAGYGSLLCAITFDSYLKELAGAEARWDKTEKVGRVAAG